jgi:hypothetical protein
LRLIIPADLAPVHVSQRARLRLADLGDMRVIRAVCRLDGRSVKLG